MLQLFGTHFESRRAFSDRDRAPLPELYCLLVIAKNSVFYFFYLLSFIPILILHLLFLMLFLPTLSWPYHNHKFYTNYTFRLYHLVHFK